MTAAPPRTNAKGGELAPLRIPDYGWDRVLSDATRRQSTNESHLMASSRSLFGKVQRAQMVGKTPCKVARCMASSQDDEQEQGAGKSNTPIKHNGPPSNDEIPHPLMDCGQGKNNNDNNDPARGRMSDEVGVGVDVAVGVGVDVASGKDGKQTSDGEDDATGNDSAQDVHKAIAGVNYPIAGAPHPINKPLRLRTCESIPPPPHGQPHLWVVQSRCALHCHLLKAQPHLWVVQLSRADSAHGSRYHHRTVQSHLRVAQ